MNDKQIRKHLLKEYQDIKITALDCVDSTNSYAKRLVSDGDGLPQLIVANQQTAGRGRHGKSFFSPRDKGIYLSLILPIDPTTTSLITVTAAVAAARVIEQIGTHKADIKWVNDIFISGKKVCGILCEAVSSSAAIPDCVIIGIGINLSITAQDFPQDLRTIAGSVFPEKISRSEIVAKVCNELLSLLAAPPPLAEYKERLFILGKQIEYTKNSIKKCGIAMDINSDANLIVKCDDEYDTLSAGEISLGSGTFT